MPGMNPTDARNARQEASDRIGGRDARVFEPSPPAVDDNGGWMADDPLQPTSGDAVSPFGPGPTWTEVAAGDDALGAWCDERWLRAGRRLAAPPASLGTSRLALHRLAMYAIAAARINANGYMGLRWTLGGFGTPFFGADRQVRVVGDQIVIQDGDAVQVQPITTLSAAETFLSAPLARFAEEQYDVPPVGDVNEQLQVDAAATAWLGDWFALGTSVLEELRLDAPDADATRVQLWPEHFDVAIELGDGDAGLRASIGFSPGDDHHADPYVYLAPWSGVPDHPFFNATGFKGAELHVDDVVGAADPRAVTLAFIREGRALLG